MADGTEKGFTVQHGVGGKQEEVENKSAWQKRSGLKSDLLLGGKAPGMDVSIQVMPPEPTGEPPSQTAHSFLWLILQLSSEQISLHFSAIVIIRLLAIMISF